MTVDDARFVDLYERYHRHIRAYCRRRTKPELVDDAVADTFLTALRKFDDIPDGDSTLPWLYGVAFRVLGHQWRGRSRRGRLDRKLLGLGADPGPRPDDVIVARHEANTVREALSRLNKTDREILLLAAWEGLSHTEISEALKISEGAVRQRFYQAKKNLTRQYSRLDKGRSQSPAAQEGGSW